MTVKSCRLGRSVCPYARALLLNIVFSIVLVGLWAPVGALAAVRPLDGGGNFHTSVDVINRWSGEDKLDVMVLIEVNNNDLKFEEAERGYVARLRVEATLTALDGRVVTRTRQIRTAALSEADAGSPTQFQVFGVLLRDVPFREGRVTCSVTDVRQNKRGLFNAAHNRHASSECAGDWAASQGPRPQQGLSLEDPLYLMQAPIESWRPGVVRDKVEQSGWLQNYMHPSRRYGLEQDHLQLYIPVWPQAGGVSAEAEPVGLRVEVSNLEMNFVLRDTIQFDERGRMELAAGQPAALLYELDVNLLPEGAYRLSLAPLSGVGRGSLTGFDVIWRLAALARHRSLVLGEGRTVFEGRKLTNFLAATPAEQEKLLDDFWRELDPDPESPVNSVYLEFQYRLAYLQKFLGGFDEMGAVDARGEVFLLLGPADEVQVERMPMNFRDQDDARIKVYQRFAPDRGGTTAKGTPVGGQDNINPYAVEGGIPMPYSHTAERDRGAAVYSASHYNPFELWKYDRGGKPLFNNRFSDKGMGQRFLFIDRTGEGRYELESSNVVQIDE